jgi:microcystin degradation protein MlrC
MKIFAAGLATETNTFSPVPTSLEDFNVQRGSEVAAGNIKFPSLDLSDLWGARARERGYEFVFGLNAWAQPSGVTTRRSYETLRGEMLHGLRAALPVDVVLLMLHGAMVAESYDDCEEDMISRVREIVGEDVVIAVELDLHCNVSASKLAAADLVITYKEYPHSDINERARELFDLAIATKLGKIRPVMALFDCRMVGMYPTSREPMQSIVAAMHEAERRDGILSVSFAHGFQFADLAHLSAKMLVVADADQALADRTARELGQRVYGWRQHLGFDAVSLPMHAALTKAFASRVGPIVVPDQSDNPGGGAPGDATYVLRWLLDHDVGDVALAFFYDPQVVRIAKKVGRGARLSVRLGGKLERSSGLPVDIDATVTAIAESYFHGLPQQSGNPWMFPLGDVVALRCGTMDILVSSERCQCFCPTAFSDFGIDPKRKRLLIPKSYQHFYAAFAPLAAEVIYMAAPGAVPPDPRQLTYRRLDTSRLYPWVEDPFAGAP